MECVDKVSASSSTESPSLYSSLQQSMGLSVIFEDPISFEIMDNAVITICGHSFSESTITNWFKSKALCCPMCSKPLTQAQVTPNYKLREAIVTYKRILGQKNTQIQAIINATTSPLRIQSSTTTTTTTSSITPEFTTSPGRADIHNFGTPVTEIRDPFEETSSEDEIATSNSFEDESDIELPKLIVDVVRAKDLQKKDFWGVGAPYVTVEFSNEKRQTKHIKNNLSPVWNETFIFTVFPENETCDIVIQVWDSDKLIGSSFLGMLRIPFSQIRESVKVCKSYPLDKKTEKSKVKGEIKLRFIYLNPKVSLTSHKKKRRLKK